MQYDEFLKVIETNGLSRSWSVKGFSLSFNQDDGVAIISGRLPLSLCRLIFKDIDNNNLKISYKKNCFDTNPDMCAIHYKLEEKIEKYRYRPDDIRTEEIEQIILDFVHRKEITGRIDELHLLFLYAYTPEGLQHIINCIHINNYINTCLFGEYVDIYM